MGKFSLSRLFYPNHFYDEYSLRNNEVPALKWIVLDDLCIGNKIQIDGMGASACAFFNGHAYLRIRSVFFLKADFFKIPLKDLIRESNEPSVYPKFQFSVNTSPNVLLALGLSEMVRNDVIDAYEAEIEKGSDI